MSFRVRARGFDGPFDLLLSLVGRQKVDIGTISVAEVADQYLAEVESLGTLDLDVASDFVLVAATLLDLKAAALLPQDYGQKSAMAEAGGAADEDAELDELSPDAAREVLISRLLAYKQFRNAAAALAAREATEARMYPREASLDPEFQGLLPDYLEGITLRSLAVICADLSGRRNAALLEAEHVAPKRLPLALTVAAVDRMVRARSQVHFSELIEGPRTPESVVAAFLAVLELAGRGAVTLTQTEDFGDIEIAHVEGAAPFDASTELLSSTDEGV